MTDDLLADLDTFWRVRSYVDLVALPPEQRERCYRSSRAGPRRPPTPRAPG